MRKIEKPKQLLVEGKDDERFFKELIKHLALQDIQTQNFDGNSRLRSFLKVFAISPGFDTISSIGIIRDAEKSAAPSAFQSVQSSLSNAGLPAPSNLGERSGDRPTVTVKILPDDARPGMLETLLCESFSDDPVNRCIDDFFRCADKLPNTSSDRRDKARAHVYLATKPHPEVSVGVAALKKHDYWFLDHEAFSGIRDFLEGL